MRAASNERSCVHPNVDAMWNVCIFVLLFLNAIHANCGLNIVWNACGCHVERKCIFVLELQYMQNLVNYSVERMWMLCGT